jgi:hypothetical protein
MPKLQITDFHKGNLEAIFGIGVGTVERTRDIQLEWIMDQCKDDFNALFIELGIYKGSTINVCAKKKPNHTFFGFDSFEGLEKDWHFSNDRVYKVGFDWNIKNLDYEVIEVEDNVEIVEGWFRDTLPEFVASRWPKQYISFLHIDCDEYSAAYESLMTLNKLIKPGTIIRFDELTSWHMHFKNQMHHELNTYENWKNGEFKAMNDWASQKRRKLQPIMRDVHQSGTVRVIK